MKEAKIKITVSKLIVLGGVFFLLLWACLPEPQARAEDLTIANLTSADTLVCPRFDQLESFLQLGFGPETNDCSLVSWTSVARSELIGVYPIGYADWNEDQTADVAATGTDVFAVEIDGLKLFAAKDVPIDEHWLDADIFGFNIAVGVQHNVAYEVWDEQPQPVASTNSQQ